MNRDMDDKERSRERSRRERPSRFSEASRDRSMDRGRDRGGMKSSNNRVYVSNIPYEYRWQDMKDLFRLQVGDVQFVELYVDDNDKPKGCGIVEFSDSACVKKCLEVMQRYEIKGRKLVVREDSGIIRDKHGNVIGAGGKRGRENDGNRYRDDRDRYDSHGGNMRQDDIKWGNTYGLSPQFLESLNIDAPLSNKVFVANLEYNIEKKKLKEVFRLAGRVVNVSVPLNKDGCNRGFAVVEFDHPVEAVQAISMLHNQMLLDRPMTVRMDRANESVKLPEGLKSVGMGLGTNCEPLRNVAHNLPSLNSSGPSSQVGAGILGAVPNQALQVANALSGLNSVSSLGNLANPSSVLQAANLSSLLGNGLSNSDLNLASSLTSNPLVQQQSQQLPPSGNMGHNMGGGPTGLQPSYNRQMADSGYSSNQNSGGGGGGGGAGGGDYRQSQNSYHLRQSSGMGGGYGGNVGGGGGGGYNQDRGNNYNSGGGNHPGMMRSPVDDNKGGSFSRKVLVSNLPPNASYKLLHDKFNEYGDVKFFEEKGNGCMLVEFGSDRQAERAIKNLDRARIDGRIIEARIYY